jgi:hypothetical protein
LDHDDFTLKPKPIEYDRLEKASGGWGDDWTNMSHQNRKAEPTEFAHSFRNGWVFPPGCPLAASA